MNILPLAFLFLFSTAPDPEAAFCLEQARVQPEWHIEDAYKWLHQATRGGEHAITSEDAARRWLVEEWATLGPAKSDEPLWLPLTSDGRIGRLNLRPYRDRGGLPEPLLAAFIASATEFESDPSRFQTAWSALGRALKKKPQEKLTYAGWNQLDSLARKDGYAARHHSPEYEQRCQPAYRVLTAGQFQPLLESLSAP